MSKVNMAANVEALYNRRSERWRSSRNGHLSSTDVTLCATFKQRSRETKHSASCTVSLWSADESYTIGRWSSRIW